MTDRGKTIRVMIFLGSDRKSWAAGIVSKEHQGRTTLSMRLARAHPMPPLEYVPPGADVDVYRAWLALGAYLARDERAEGTDEP